MKTIDVNYMPGTDLAARIRSHRGFDGADHVMVAIPRVSKASPLELAMDVEEAEWELDLSIWVNSYTSLK